MNYILKSLLLLSLVLFNHLVLAAVTSDPSIYTEDKPNIIVTKDNSTFIIHLNSNPSTGYRWFLREYNSMLISPIKHAYEVPNTKLIGAPGYDVWTFSVKPAGFTVPQMTQIRFIYMRPWETENQGKQVFFRIFT
jgi:inhibitor of cysteine peptidase